MNSTAKQLKFINIVTDSTTLRHVIQTVAAKRITHSVFGSGRVVSPLIVPLIASVFASASFVTNAYALEFQCEVPGDTRYIRVDMPGEEHLCEVSVTYKETGVREVKWHASNDSLFCSARAYEMADKYENIWNYTCSSWPDRDGIDLLSPTQRLILDQRLRVLMDEGEQAEPPFIIQSIKATASTPLDKQPGKLALQFFTNNGDFTEIIDDQTYAWTVETTIVDLASQVEGDVSPEFALINAIDESSTLEVYTQLIENDIDCYGSQLLSAIGETGDTEARSPHLYVCDSAAAEQTTDDPSPLDGSDTAPQ